MITKTSALYHLVTNSYELNASRAQVLIKLFQCGMSINDVAEAINSSESLVRSVLVRPFRPFDPYDANNPIRTIDTVHGPSFPDSAGAAPPVNSHALKGATGREQEDFARYLAEEIRQWLGTFEATDAERQQAVEQAGFDLDKLAFQFDGKYLFETGWVAHEIGAVWKPTFLLPDDRAFRNAAGRSLAAWIRFWITDPDIWDRALDIAFEHFGARAQAA
jgi:hypothetical protein